MTMLKFAERMRDDRGSVGVLLAMAMFVVVGMLFMTWNTAQLSKEKMRLQNAADAAALEHAAWQARGMNAVQNINDEAYITAQTACVLVRVAEGFEGLAKIVSTVPLVGKWFAIGFRTIASIIGGVTFIMTRIVLGLTMYAIGTVYANASCALGLLGAQALAKANGATPLFDIAALDQAGLVGGFYAFGVSLSAFVSTFVLPVERKDQGCKPWKADFPEAEWIFSGAGVFSKIYQTLKLGKPWNFKPYVSKGYTVEKTNYETNFVDRTESVTNEYDLAEKREKDYREALEDFNKKEREVAEIEWTITEAERQGWDVTSERERLPDAMHERELARKRLDEMKTRYEGWQRGDRTRYDDDERKWKDVDSIKTNKVEFKTGAVPGATVWIAFKAAKGVHTLPLNVWAGEDKSQSRMHDSPLFAISAARCVSGDVIPHSKGPKDKEVNQRPTGFGTGATAKLVPIIEAFGEISKNEKVSKALKGVIGIAFYH